MRNTQRIILAVYLFLTLVMVFFDIIYRDDNPALYVTFAVRVSMFITVVAVRKRYREQKLIALAFAFTVLSDYYFVFVNTFDETVANSQLFGMIGFIGAYLCLIITFSKNFNIGKRELITIAPFAAIFTFLFLSLQQYAEGFMYPAGIVLGIILCIFGMTMVSTLFRGYFSKRVAWLLAISGCMMFFSDLFVALALYHPDFKVFLLWREIVVMVTYVPAWTLLMLVVTEENLYVEIKAKNIISD